ncbi:hypothetical protein D5086_019249 [Populus alba]|uniref:Uncharacterized protein n=1 Tax=Populus alba TaxID=43335 RepID=A0ACC4BGP1_POPAL
MNNTLSILSSPYISKFNPSLFPPLPQTLGFYCLQKPKPKPKPRPFNSFRLLSLSNSPNSFIPAESQLSDAENDEEEEYEDDEDEDEEEDEAADEYDDISEALEEEAETEISVHASSSDVSNWRKESKWQRVEKLCNEVKEFGNEIIDANELASIYDFRIDKFQRLAIEAFLKGSSVVVSAPTSSGKTLIAEAAAVATVARGRRIFYTTPLKALSNQKFRDFRETFGDENVGLLTGDSAINKDAQVLIMTTEILRNMLYQSIGMVSSGSGLFHVDVIVLDEVHFLSDISRGTVWEEIIIYCPKEVQLICLSATVKNPDELSGWIREVHGETELVTSSRRPVPLTWHFSTRHSLYPLLDEKRKHMNRKLSLNYLQLSASRVKSYKDDGSRRRNSRKRGSNMGFDSIGNMSEEPLSKNDISRIRRSQVPQVVDTLAQLKARDMLPAIWFIFNRRGCDAAVQYLEGCRLLDECEASEVELALKRFSVQNPDAVRETAVKGLLRGVAAHHAGCLPLWKSFIEELFQRGLIKVVFATETLAAGINMPARTAVISSLSRRSSSGRIPLSPNELLQMAGRAGRRGIDERGHVVLVQASNEGAEECCKLLFAGLEPLVSQFTASYGMVLNLLAGAKITRRSNESNEMKVLQAGRTLKEARKLVEKSFGTYIGSNVMLASKEELAKIQKEIEMLTSETSDDAIDRKSRKILSDGAYKEIAILQEQLREEKRLRTELRRKMETKRLNALKILLKELGNDRLPFLCLKYKDSEGVEHSVPAVYLGDADSFDGSKFKNMVSDIDSLAQTVAPIESNVSEVETHKDVEPSYHVALGSDNSWYLFTEKWIKTVYRTGLPNVALSLGDDLPHEVMWMLLDREEKQWEKLAESELGGLWALDINTQVIFPLGETAAAIRGENELWLAMVLRSRILLDLKPGQLAAVCASVVSEGIKVRAWENNNYIYEPSSAVINVINILNEQRSNLSKLQEKHGVEITCCLDSQFSGMVEAWAAGLTWKEMMMDCAMDDGDLARLLRRTIDILAQIPKLPDIDPVLQSNAKTASSIMDRPPISELTG